MCAARVGGILDNSTFPIEFLLDNLAIQKNLLMAAKKNNLKRIIFLGSSCIYPKNAKIPIKEDYLMTGKLEKTNESYALSKIIGIKLCEILHDKFKKDIICLMPTNLYGENDNFDIASSHVIPGLISKFLNAKKLNKDVKIWGSGKPVREFLHVEDLARAILLFLKISKSKLKKTFKSSLPVLNVGSGESVQIKKLASLIKKLSKFHGNITYDKSYPDGTFIKNLDSSKIKKLNWRPTVKLSKGLQRIIKSRN